MTPRLKERYHKETVPALIKEFKYSSLMQAPRVSKVTLNMGLGEGSKDAKIIEAAVKDMTSISGQKPVVTRAKKSIAAFKLREGMPVGCMVTLRGNRMYEFLDRFVNFNMPRIRDFRGVSDRAFDGRGNYTIGIKEQIIFPEIDYDKIDRIRGMNITITTSAGTDEEGKSLLKHLGMPFSQ
jgi:large subunit ribosomal protein L5